MSNSNEHQWKDMSDFSHKTGQNLNILEEEIDIRVQKKYFELINSLSKKKEEYPALCQKYIERINDLLDAKVSSSTKKEMLAVLATIDDVAIYRAIETFSKLDSPLKKWATVALQQSRMLIQSVLLDNPGVFISTGLGGQGDLLRYFGVFLHNTNEKLAGFQRNIIKNETELEIKSVDGVLEKIHYYEGYTTILLLLPIHIKLKPFFENIIDVCNQFGDFLHENMIVTNVKKLNKQDISGILAGRDKKI